MSKNLVFSGQITAVDTSTNLGDNWAGTAVTQVVPANVSRLVRVNIGGQSSATATGGANLNVLVSGDGVNGPEQPFVGPGTSALGSVAGGQETTLPHVSECNIAVTPGGQITVNGALTGVDPGTVEAAVELLFQ